MRIWYFHPYGAAPGYGKYLRPYYLSLEWSTAGHDVISFVGQHHHLTDTEDALPARFSVEGQVFRALTARPYKGNGVGRFLNMIDYCRAMLRETESMAAADVVIASSPHPFTIFPAWALAKRHRAKLVFEVRDIWPLSITEMTKTPKWHPIVLLSWFAERFAMSRADLVASLLGNAEEHMRRVGMKGAFVHVPNAAPGEASVPASEPKSEPGKVADRKIKEWRAQGRTIIVHPGTQGYPSALDTLLHAIGLLRERHPAHKVAVLLVGGGDTGANLQKLSTNLGLDEIIAFIPPVPKSDAVYLTGLCDIGYAGKRNFERVFKYGISFNKIIDFMQAGMPVILPVTTKGDPVSSSGCGIVTGDEPTAIADGIRQMLEMSSEERAAMGAKGSAYLRTNLSYPQVAANYIAAIKGIRA